MLASIEKWLVDGPGGAIELALDWPANVPQGIVYIGHPHPLYGGTLDNKVVATIARSFAGLGWLAVRFNFRGVGRSAGEHDEGNGETEDFLHLIDTVPTLPAVSSRLPRSTADRRRRLFVRQFCCRQGRAAHFLRRIARSSTSC